MKTLDILENVIRSIPEYVFIPDSELNIFHNLEGLQFGESFFEINEPLEIQGWEINLDDDTLEILGENEDQKYILVFKNDNKLLSELKRKVRLIEEEYELSTEEEDEDSNSEQ